VRVRGHVERYREQLQITLASIARAPHEQGAAERFLPAAYRDVDELEGFFEHLAREVYDPGLAGLLARMLADSRLRAELRRAPCSLPANTARAQGSASAAARAGHHAYLGGLLEHSVAVATMALELCSLHPRLDRDLLLCGALVHDVGKTREFSYGAEIELSADGRLLGHLQLGEERRLALEHCLLLHHGPEAASGQRFAFAEALALYRLNALDAHLKSAFEHGFPRP